MPPHHSCFVDAGPPLSGTSTPDAAASPIGAQLDTTQRDRSSGALERQKSDKGKGRAFEGEAPRLPSDDSLQAASSSNLGHAPSTLSRSSSSAGDRGVEHTERPPSPRLPPLTAVALDRLHSESSNSSLPDAHAVRRTTASSGSHSRPAISRRQSHSPSSSATRTPIVLPPTSAFAGPSILPSIVTSLTCWSCDEVLTDPTTLPCGHTVCLACAQPPRVIRPLHRLPPPAVNSTYNAHDEGRSRSLERSVLPRSPNSASMITSTHPFHLRRSTSPAGSPLRARIACPNPACSHKESSSSSLPLLSPKIDFVLQNVLTIMRREILDFDDLGGVESDQEALVVPNREGSGGAPVLEALDERGLASVGSPLGSDSSSLSGGGGEDYVGPDAKRSHKTRRWKPEKRTRRRSRTVSATECKPRKGGQVAELSATLLLELQAELECQVCTQLYHDPITSPCGHTFCQKCLTRSLDHSAKCPLCRGDFPSFSYIQSQPINAATRDFIMATFPLLAEERRAAIEAEEKSTLLDTPIFVCTLAWPNLPTFLHVFEPRYRLMLRRVMSGDGQFGMVLPSRVDGGVHEYGTMLKINSCNVLDDGRSVVETIGTYRFRLLEKGNFDGYTVGRIERIVDVSPEQEAELERIALASNATGTVPRPANLFAASAAGSAPPSSPPGRSGVVQLPVQTTQANVELSTQQLVEVCLEFVQMLRSGSAPWVLQRLNNTIGPMPDSPSDFSFWMAEVMPLDEYVKAALLEITSARERLRLIVFWIEQLRSSWWFSRGCSIM